MPDNFTRTGIAYRRYGPADAPAILLIQGVAMQLIDWPEPLIGQLSQHFQTVVFDHLGTGRSVPVVTPEDFTLFDLAQDAVELLDELGLVSAHLVGYSMGGMVAQLVAARHPQRVRSLVTLMSNAGQSLRTASPAARDFLQTYAERDVDEETAVGQEVKAAAYFLGCPASFDEQGARRAARARLERGYRPDTVALQLRAIDEDATRRDIVKDIRAPWLVVHGSRDDLIPPRDARGITARNPNARYIEIPGMSHDFLLASMPQIGKMIVEHCDAFDRPGGGAACGIARSS